MERIRKAEEEERLRQQEEERKRKEAEEAENRKVHDNALSSLLGFSKAEETREETQ